MSAGSMILTIAAVLVYCGLLQRALDRLRLTDRQALMLVGAMLIGTFLPNLRFGPVSINLGGAIIPFGVCVYLFLTADERQERTRSIWGSLLTAVAVYLLSALLPDEAEQMLLDPMWIYGLSGGVIAWLLGRSRRAAFICGVMGMLLADVANSIVITLQGYKSQLYLGGAGIADATVISGALAVFMCELVGETIERFARTRIERRTSRP